MDDFSEPVTVEQGMIVTELPPENKSRLFLHWN